MSRPARLAACILLFPALATLLAGRTAAVAPQAPAAALLTDAELWHLSSGLSEAAGVFPQQLMSNEDSAQFVLPQLRASVTPGGVYIGVGSEQNFTYIAALRPRLAFVVDIRRENLLQMLMYQALFELAPERSAFVAMLFSRERPPNLAADATAAQIFAAYHEAPSDARRTDETARMVIEALTVTHGWPIPEADRAAIAGMLAAFRAAGPDLKGYGDRTNPTFADLMSATDLAGAAESFLASEANYTAVRDLERHNVVVPIVGDFAGDRALSGIGAYLNAQGAAVDVFYVSNVERYLFEQGARGMEFYRNVSLLPRRESSVFVRSVTRDISTRLGIPIPATPATKWWTAVFSIRDCLDGVANGRIRSYADLFAR